MPEIYDRGYFESDDQTRGYRNEGYRDFACHYATAHEVISFKPSSVIEIGAGRGYITKIVKNAEYPQKDILAMDMSPHCWHTRVIDEFALWDITEIPWMRGRGGKLAPLAIKNKEFDLCFSIALLEHIPEDRIDDVIRESIRVSHRGLHAVSVTEHCNKEWWIEKFKQIAPNYPVKITDKNEMEYNGDMQKIMPLVPRNTRDAGGRIHKKINFGSFINMFYYGWLNIDILDVGSFALSNGYKFIQMDVAKPLTFPDGYADCIFASHLVEHLSREEGARFISECFRILRPGGVIRIATPNVCELMHKYIYDVGKYGDRLNNYKDVQDDDKEGLKQYRHVNVGVESAQTPLDAFAHLILSGHKSIYDEVTLYKMLIDAGFGDNVLINSPFESLSPIMTRETFVSHPTLSITIDAVKPMVKRGKKQGGRKQRGKKR